MNRPRKRGSSTHYLILREKPETLEVVEIFHERMNIEVHLKRLAGESPS